jgi:2-succinyl-5-enolpyruvyl-6-hydroxy-3-cyclohexene-1-carboxylate synthase
VVVVVVNNDGGGIFHFLPIREYDDFDPYFTTPHGRDFEDAAATFDLPYHRPETPADFRATYEEACRSDISALIEVQTDREANRRVHEALEQTVATTINDSPTL